MNRLWVRITLAIIGSLVILLLLSMAFRQFAIQLDIMPGGEPISDELAEFIAAIPAPLMEQLRETLRREFWRTFLQILALGSGLALLFGIWTSRSLAAPLSELERGARAIETGDLSRRVEPGGSDEMRAVAGAFNSMASRLEEAERLRQNLLADVAHELRNPVQVLQGNLQAMLDDVYPLSKEEIARLSDQTQHLSALIQDLHDLAQADADQLPLHRQATNMADLVKAAAAAYRPLALAEGIEMRVELLGALPVLDVDPDRMKQVTINLLSNAVRYTPRNGHILVQLEKIDSHVELRVQDSGPGIPAAHAAHIFDRFYRTDSARSRADGGTGLGLAITRAIVEAHGGTITADSSPEGALFVVRLPIRT